MHGCACLSSCFYDFLGLELPRIMFSMHPWIWNGQSSRLDIVLLSLFLVVLFVYDNAWSITWASDASVSSGGCRGFLIALHRKTHILYKSRLLKLNHIKLLELFFPHVVSIKTYTLHAWWLTEIKLQRYAKCIQAQHPKFPFRLSKWTSKHIPLRLSSNEFAWMWTGGLWFSDSVAFIFSWTCKLLAQSSGMWLNQMVTKLYDNHMVREGRHNERENKA